MVCSVPVSGSTIERQRRVSSSPARPSGPTAAAKAAVPASCGWCSDAPSSATSWLANATVAQTRSSRARQRPKRLGLITVGLKQPKAVPVGARQLAQNEPVKPIGLAARGAEAITRRLDLIGMQGPAPAPPPPKAAPPAPHRGARSPPPRPCGAPSQRTTPRSRSHRAKTCPPATPRRPRQRSARRSVVGRAVYRASI